MLLLGPNNVLLGKWSCFIQCMKVAMLHYSNCFSAAVKIMQISMALFKIIGAATDCLVEGHMYVAGL